MLATLEKTVPKGDDWLYEVKWDGYRALAYVTGGDVALFSRNENDLTARFASVAKAIGKALRTPNAVLDGEVCALDEQGRATFSAMQQGKAGTRYVFVAFDVLEIDGEPVIGLELTERRERLGGLLDKRVKAVQFSESFDDGEALFEVAKQQGFEGIMAKRPHSTYQPGRRTRDWVKVKATNSQEFVIGRASCRERV